MAAKNRNKNSSQPNSSEKPPASSPQSAQRAQSNASGSLLKLLSALSYMGFVAGTVIVSVCFYQELSEIKHSSSRHEQCVQKSADAQQQIRSMQASLEALESAVLGVRTDLERTGRAAQKGEDNTRRLEDSLQNLQSKISQELTQAIREVKEAREKHALSLEERLSQLSHSTAESSVQQSQFQSELQELRARLEQQDAPALLRQELESLSSAVATLHTASEVSEGNMAVLREQIAAVSAEQQTRNREVASVSEDVEAVRTLLQSAAGSLRDEMSAARADAQSASDQTQSLSDRLEHTSTALQSLETHSRDQLLQLEKHREDVAGRLKSVEESQEGMESSLTEQTNRLNALTAKHESQQRSLGDYKTTAETESQALRDGLDGLRSRLEELQTQVSELDAGQEKEAVDAFKNVT
ncbi:cytoskeleton-associated protein 4 [Sinocyclocheilus grahami]|uniref:Myosin-7B-like n=1 Tax=Sinocyclocheilus grahami TaxID=75366 RepID=A0A672LGB8_SINGR|nr:PREDICTED: myosin-7B-like [Sinocyclocheilus grahami]